MLTCLLPQVSGGKTPTRTGQSIITCPICHRDTPVPATGTAGLQPAFHINHLLDIAEDLKMATGDPPASAKTGEDKSPPAPGKITASCCDHKGKETELYCETCQDPVCWKCVVKGGKHQSHDYQELQEAFEKRKQRMIASLEVTEQSLTTMKKTITQLERHRKGISTQQNTIEVNVRKSFKKLHKMLDVRETRIIGELHHLTQKKLKSLTAQRGQIEMLQAKLTCCLALVRKNLETGSQREILKMGTPLVKKVKELTSFTPETLKPNTKADMMFSASSDFVAACQNYGQILESSFPDPSKCHATGTGTKAAKVGEAAAALLKIIDFVGAPCRKPISSFECKLVSEITRTVTQGSIERKGQSEYKINYHPTVKGRHQLHIKVEGQHISGSPFNIAVKSPVE